MRKSLCIACLVLSVIVPADSPIKANTVNPPSIDYSFPSAANKILTLMPVLTGLANPVDVNLQSSGPTTVRSELPANAYTQNGRDTIDTEMLSLLLNGTAAGYDVSIRAGANNGYFPGLRETHGQIQDYATSPLDGTIDFQADSFFDVFFDIHIDLNHNGLTEDGEVLRNFDEAMRMQNPALDSIPPTPHLDPYWLAGIVLAGDPNIGTFEASLLTVPPNVVNLYWVAPDGSKASPDVAAMIRYPNIVHDPVPDGGLTLGMLGALVGVFMFGAWWRNERGPLGQ